MPLSLTPILAKLNSILDDLESLREAVLALQRNVQNLTKELEEQKSRPKRK